MNAPLLEGAAVAAVMMALGHWFPLAESWKQPSVPRRLFAYVWGVGWILIGLYIATDADTALRGLFVAAAAGITTGLAYVVDYIANEPAREALRNGPKS